MNTKLALRPSYWASVSGGKDSFYMLNLILHNMDKYPLDGVVHYELEIDFPFIHDVIDYIETECNKFGIRFVRVKPRKTWEELYYTKNHKNGSIWGYPTRRARWCNSMYKLDAAKQVDEWLNSQGYYRVRYIGYCADEESRFIKRLNDKQTEIYPLVEQGIIENEIWEWAKAQPIYNNYYIANKRCGCMYCPMASRMEQAYLFKYYPEHFNYMVDKMRESEKLEAMRYGRPFSVISSNPKYNADYLDNIIKTKWIYKLNEIESTYAGKIDL